MLQPTLADLQYYTESTVHTMKYKQPLNFTWPCLYISHPPLTRNSPLFLLSVSGVSKTHVGAQLVSNSLEVPKRV